VDASKVYRAEIELGVATDTYDASGRITERGDSSKVSRGQVRAALESFCGEIQQVPPMFSAVKHRGKPLYKLARAGITVERRSRPLGCGASLKSLVRLRCGLFDIKDAVSVHNLEDAFRYGYWQRFLHPIDSVLSHWKAMIVSDDRIQALRNGSPLVLEGDSSDIQYITAGPTSGNRCRVYTPTGCLLGVLRFNPERGQWQPDKVFL